ncbi:hypothetical protein OCF63_12410 [Bacillus wiedmannii]|uniref:hypothetical protein n=1 Tax=Bacillus wiedmannii TaxID=1890302 RepID=UPI0021D101BA|nr:hypothetical protein [Bacillus wiedmannii]MCU5498796.1 hypothetical protein [Bacillus wiedmannii]
MSVAKNVGLAENGMTFRSLLKRAFYTEEWLKDMTDEECEIEWKKVLAVNPGRKER